MMLFTLPIEVICFLTIKAKSLQAKDCAFSLNICPRTLRNIKLTHFLEYTASTCDDADLGLATKSKICRIKILKFFSSHVTSND